MRNWIDNMPKPQYFRIEGHDGVVEVQVGGEAKMIFSAFRGDESGFLKYQDNILGIERRWDALMKRRSEPKRAMWKLDVLGEMPNN